MIYLPHLAATNGYHQTVRVLIELGAKVGATDWSSNTPLLNAAIHGQIETVLALVDLGANREAMGDGDRTPLLAAAAAGQHETVRVLLEELGSDKGATDKASNTALHLAARGGPPEDYTRTVHVRSQRHD